MIKQNIKYSGFSLAKNKELVGEDYYEAIQIDDLVVAVVCDGVGSAIEGANAAKRVTNHIITNFKSKPQSWSLEKSIKKFITSINAMIYNESIQNYEKPELVTTLALVVIQGDRLYGANVGDSRIYLNRDKTLTQLSKDHTLDDKGYENVLTNAIGLDSKVEIYYFENNLKKDDIVLLCSDGLYNTLKNNLKSYINLGANFLVKKASSLTQDNLEDDTTAITIQIVQENQIQKLKSLNLPIPVKLKKGDVYDGYELLKPLIQNNRTWECKKNNRNYIIKFAPVEAIEDNNILDLFIKEAVNSKRLKAGFFPKAVIPKKRGARYYIQTKLNGVTLKEYIKKRSLHIDDTITLAKMLLNMAQYLLKFDLVHGDIKPENIIVTKRDDKLIFKIIDFGSMCELYSIDSRAGTPSYIAPERFEKVSISESTEIFAIGVVLYEVLTQKFPYGEIEPFSTPIFKKPKLPKKYNFLIPNWLESILLRAISVDNTMRYKNYSQMLFEIENSDKVKPFFDPKTPLIEKDPEKFYKIAFFISFIINIILLIN